MKATGVRGRCARRPSRRSGESCPAAAGIPRDGLARRARRSRRRRRAAPSPERRRAPRRWRELRGLVVAEARPDTTRARGRAGAVSPSARVRAGAVLRERARARGLYLNQRTDAVVLRFEDERASGERWIGSVASIGRAAPDFSRQITEEEREEGRSITEYSETDDPGRREEDAPSPDLLNLRVLCNRLPTSSTNWRQLINDLPRPARELDLDARLCNLLRFRKRYGAGRQEG